MGGFVRQVTKSINKGLGFVFKGVSKLLNVATFGLLKGSAKRPPLSSSARERKSTVRSSTQPRRLIYGKIRVGGTLVFAESSGDKNKYLHLVLALAGHQVEAIDNYNFNENSHKNSAKVKGKTLIQNHLGSSNQTANKKLVDQFSLWTNNHKGQGIAYSYVRLTWDEDLWQNGIPTITADVKGAKVYDPRTKQTKWSDNPALCILDYLRSQDGLYAQDAEIDWDYWKAAANACDEDIVIKRDGTKQKRYRIHTEISLNYAPADIIEDLLTSCAGALVYTGGKYRLFVGVQATPTATLNEDDLRGSIKLNPRPPRSELFNAVRGTYVNPDENWEATEFPLVTNALYESQDGNERIIRDIDLSCTTDSIQAQRLAKIILEESRQSTILEFPAKMSALSISVWDVVRLNIKSLGYENKLFRVISWKLEERGGVNLTLQEYAAQIYDWHYGEATTIDPAPDSNLPIAQSLTPPQHITATSGENVQLSLSNGTIIPRIRLNWEISSFSALAHFELNYRLATDDIWTSTIIGPNMEGYFINHVHLNELYEFRLRSFNIFRSTSAWSSIVRHRVVGKIFPPTPGFFRFENLPQNKIKFSWDIFNQPDDVLNHGGFRIRYGKGIKNHAWESMTNLQDNLISGLRSSFEITFPKEGLYNFAIKSVNLKQNLSHQANVIVARVENLKDKNYISFNKSFADQGWKGELINFFISPKGSLETSSSIKVSQLADSIQSLPNSIRLCCGSSFAGYYKTTFDLGRELSFTFSIKPQGTYSRIYYVLQGSDGQSYSNPNTIVKGRSFVFSIYFYPHNTICFVDDLELSFEAEGKVFRYNDINTSSNTDSWFKRVGKGHFLVAAKGLSRIVQASITAIQGGHSGWTWSLVKKDATIDGIIAAEFKIFDAQGNLQDAVIDVTLKGYPKPVTPPIAQSPPSPLP